MWSIAKMTDYAARRWREQVNPDPRNFTLLAMAAAERGGYALEERRDIAREICHEAAHRSALRAKAKAAARRRAKERERERKKTEKLQAKLPKGKRIGRRGELPLVIVKQKKPLPETWEEKQAIQAERALEREEGAMWERFRFRASRGEIAVTADTDGNIPSEPPASAKPVPPQTRHTFESARKPRRKKSRYWWRKKSSHDARQAQLI